MYGFYKDRTAAYRYLAVTFGALFLCFVVTVVIAYLPLFFFLLVLPLAAALFAIAIFRVLGP